MIAARRAAAAASASAAWSARPCSFMPPDLSQGPADRECGLPGAAQLCLGLLDVHAMQLEQVLPEDLPLGLLGQLRIAVALAQVLRDLEVHERVERPLRAPDRRL